MRLILIASGLAIVAVLMSGPASAAGGLAQRDETIQLSPKEAHQLALYFRSPVVSPVMPPVVKQILIAAAPPQFKPECNVMVSGWGRVAAGSASVSVRLIGPGEGGIWVAYRCGSRLLDLTQYYDERLAMIEPGTLRFFALEPGRAGHAHDPILYYHVNFAEQLKLTGASASSFFVFATSEQPGAQDARGDAEDRLLIIAETPAGIRPVLDLTTARWQIVRQIVRKDSDMRKDSARNAHAISYRAHLGFERDTNGRLVAITDRFEEHPPGGGLPRIGILRYVWDAAAGSFVVRN